MSKDCMHRWKRQPGKRDDYRCVLCGVTTKRADIFARVKKQIDAMEVMERPKSITITLETELEVEGDFEEDADAD